MRLRRFAIFLVILGVHLVIGLLLIADAKIRALSSSALTAELVFLPFLAKHEATPTRLSPANTALAQFRQEPKPPVLRLDTDEPNNAITSPDVDWEAEAQAGAARAFEQKDREGRQRNLSGPAASDLENSRSNAPIAPDHHVMGDTERAEGGEVLTWVDDKCYWTTKGLNPNGMPTTTKTCKDPPKPDTELFKDLTKKLDDSSAQRLP